MKTSLLSIEETRVELSHLSVMSGQGTGPSPSTSTSTNNNQSNTRSRLLMLTPSPSASTSTPATTKVPPTPLSNAIDEKLFSKYSNTLVAEGNRRKVDSADHLKRLAELRKEAEYLEHDSWMYDTIDKLLGK